MPNSHTSSKVKAKRSYLITDHNLPSKAPIVGTKQPGPESGSQAVKGTTQIPHNMDTQPQPLEDFKWTGWVEKARDYHLYPNLVNH